MLPGSNTSSTSPHSSSKTAKPKRHVSSTACETETLSAALIIIIIMHATIHTYSISRSLSNNKKTICFLLMATCYKAVTFTMFEAVSPHTLLLSSLRKRVARPFSISFRYFCLDSDEVLRRIGRNSEIILDDMNSFCRRGPFAHRKLMSPDLYARDVKLTVQEGPNNILFSFTGVHKYRVAHNILHRVMPMSYGFCYGNLKSSTRLLGPPQEWKKGNENEPVVMKVKWSLCGKHRPPHHILRLFGVGEDCQRSNEILLEAYSFYYFSPQTGRVASHVIDWTVGVPPVDVSLELQQWLVQSRDSTPRAASSPLTSRHPNNSKCYFEAPRERKHVSNGSSS